MDRESRTGLFTSNKIINWIHILGVAPGLLYLRAKPQLLEYTPYVAAGIAAFHGYEIYAKGKRVEYKRDTYPTPRAV